MKDNALAVVGGTDYAKVGSHPPPGKGLVSGKIDHSLIVKKANDLATAQVGLNTWASRVLEAAFGMYYLNKQPIISFHLKDILQVLGSNSRRPYQDADDIANSLMAENVRIEMRSRNGSSRWVYHRLVDLCVYERGEFTVHFSPQGMALLDVERNYTSYLYSLGNKNDSYANAFFNVIAANAYTGVYTDTIEVFRRRLNIAENKWTAYGHLKSRCIKKVVQAINDTGAFTVVLEREIKNGHPVVGLEFSIVDNREFTRAIPHDAGEQAEMEIEMTDEALLRLLESGSYQRGSHDIGNLEMIKDRAGVAGVPVPEYVQSNIQYMWNVKERDPSKTLSGGYLINALKNDYARKDREKRAAALLRETQEQLKLQAQSEHRLLKQHHAQLFTNTGDLIPRLSKKQQKSTLERVKSALGLMRTYKALCRDVDSLDDPRLFESEVPESLVRSFVSEVLQESFPEEFPDLPTFAKSRSVSVHVMELIEADS